VGPFSHVGLVVASLEAAMAELGPVLDTTWTEVAERPVGGWTLRVTFAVGGPPFLELIESVPGSPWEATGVHHLGWWADRDGERERLAALDLHPDVDGSAIGALFDYYRAPESGLRIELVDASAREAFHRRWGLTDTPS
jgi:hypothetical protein